ncbi:hypothetical protein CFPU101_38910 [Chroococcus sp. FPU101]|nr:hypothetical protein CFPU101_38910 [Chroococcus sp. FPU101]
MLELGVLDGGSSLLWRDYFPHGTIVGIDLKLPDVTELAKEERIHLFEGNQVDTDFLSKVANQIAPEGFDIIIDDASHIGALTKISFWHLFDNHLKPSGVYVIEDWGTGYWDDWPDGKTFQPKLSSSNEQENVQDIKLGFKDSWHNHNYGMVGFLKELVDEQGAEDLTRGLLSGRPTRKSKFHSITINPSLVFVKKNAA